MDFKATKQFVCVCVCVWGGGGGVLVYEDTNVHKNMGTTT